MQPQNEFGGFPEAGLVFLEELAANNNRSWFDANKERFQKDLLKPAQEFVLVIGTKLQQISPHIRVDDSTNGSGNLMRIYRDTRFSSDKRPYKNAIAGMFWEGRGKKTESPAFGFHLEPGGMALMVGMFTFPKPMLEAYRKAVADETTGQALQAILEIIQRMEIYTLNGEQYIRVPSDFDANHPRADLLRYKGLYFSTPVVKREQVLSASLVDTVFDHYSALAPLQQWLVEIAEKDKI